jgi:urocanate hydratase
MGVIRHVDAGYPLAEEVAAQRGVRIPMTESAENTGSPASGA